MENDLRSPPTEATFNTQVRTDASSHTAGGCDRLLAGQDGERGCRPLDLQARLPRVRRRLNLGATPDRGTLPSTIDLDLTVDCNLRCHYCFKEKRHEDMEEEVAFDAIIWFLHASGPVADLSVNLMGGEPLLRFPLIEKLVPFAKRRAWQMNKLIHFGVTTNCTLVTDQVIDLWKRWGMGFHTSIDGTPEIQDLNRPTAGGRGSSRLVERAVPKILAYRPEATARCTVTSETVGAMVDSYRYFRALGYVNMAFGPAECSLWAQNTIALFEEQLSRLGQLVVDEFRANQVVSISALDHVIEGIVQKEPPSHPCGAGRGSVLIDVHGDIWPCHRWNKQSEEAWRIGSIYDRFDELVRAPLDEPSQTARLGADCKSCVASLYCSGGCPAENLEEMGHPFKPHPNICEVTRSIFRVGRRVHDVLYGEKNAPFLERYYGRDEREACVPA